MSYVAPRRIVSVPTTVSVVSQSLPYSLPASGQAVAIGTNNAQSSPAVRPAAMDAFNWNYALWNSYGGGCVVPGYSAAGAYVRAGQGGHAHPSINGAVIFDFQTATWSRVDPQNNPYKTAGYTNNTEVSGSPWYEILVSGSPGGVPAPAHPYTQLCPIGVDGTYTKGGAVYIGRAAATTAAIDVWSCHVINLATGVWSRYSDGTNVPYDGGGGNYASGVWDPVRNRYWAINADLGGSPAVWYMSPTTRKWVSVASSNKPSNVYGGAAMMYQTYIVRRQMNSTKWWMIDPSAGSPTWTQLNMTGDATLGNVDFDNDLAYFPSSNCFYGIGNSGGSSLVRVRPPASSPFTNQWTVELVSIGASLPSSYASEVGRQVVYVPGIDRLAYFAGGSASVYLIHPGS